MAWLLKITWRLKREKGTRLLAHKAHAERRRQGVVDEAGGVWVEPCAWAFGCFAFTGWSLTGFICRQKSWRSVGNKHQR